MCRSADDCGLVMAAITAKDPFDPTTVDRPWAARPAAKKRWKVGVIKDSASKAQPEVRRNFEKSIEVLRGFCDVVDEVEFPDFPYGPAVSTIVQAEGASAFRSLIESGGTLKLRQANDKFGGFAASTVLAVDYLQAMRLRGPMKRALDPLYAGYDALVAPSRQTVSYPIGVDFDKAYPNVGGGPAVIPAGNLVGQPAISVLNGFGSEGLPTGLQLTGRAFGDETLVEIAVEFQRRTGWHTKRPAV
jgi:aspartyl-tRNA(Asn)/glutamyl-tRNA(Gln) amidotransferase subunit A